MVDLLKRIDTLDGFYAAVEGYGHLPSKSLMRHLISNYAVDLDLIQDFLSDFERRKALPPVPVQPFAALAA